MDKQNEKGMVDLYNQEMKELQDSKKQIDEMAKIIFEKAFENYETSGSVEIDTEVRRRCYSAFLVYCEAIFNAGYRKIHEGAVVLTREEAVDLFNSKASGFMTSAIGDIPLNIDGMRKLVDEVSRLLIVQGELQDLNAKYYNEAKDLRRKLNNDGAIYSRLEVDGFIDKTRKETAEKFAERLKAKLDEWLKDNEDNDGKIDFGIAEIELIGVESLEGEVIVESLINEIAKEITEGK